MRRTKKEMIEVLYKIRGKNIIWVLKTTQKEGESTEGTEMDEKISGTLEMLGCSCKPFEKAAEIPNDFNEANFKEDVRIFGFDFIKSPDF